MKKQQLACLFTMAVTHLFAQSHIGVNLKLEATKTWKLDKKFQLEAKQQLQATPELSRDHTKFGNIFSEINLFPDDDSDNDGIDDADDDTNGAPISQPLGTLDDAPYAIFWEYRSVSSIQAEYRVNNFMRLESSYALNYNGKFRHSILTNINFREKLNADFKLTQRVGFQYTSRTKAEKTVWEEALLARAGFEWDFKKKHSWETEITVNGAFEDKLWQWDRLRFDTSLEYQFTKVQSFEFGYRFQQTIEAKPRTSHGVNLAYVLDF